MAGTVGRGGIVAFGTAGWSYADWAGRVFAPGERDGLGILARVFDVAEVNSTYYRIPAPDVAHGWIRKVSHNPTFSFTVKLWRGFTHERQLGRKDVDAFLAAIRPLDEAGRLGGLLMQFPWKFQATAENRGLVERLGAAFSPFARIVEFRHASWDGEDNAAWLSAQGLGLCSIDQPLFAGSLGPAKRLCGEIAYVRLHGRNREAWFRSDATRDERYDYCYEWGELRPWARRIGGLAAQAGRVFVITNNHFQGQAVINALELKAQVTGETPRIPARWLECWPRLAKSCLAEAAVQGRLFS